MIRLESLQRITENAKSRWKKVSNALSIGGRTVTGQKFEMLLTAVSFIRMITAVIITVTYEACWYTAAGVFTLELIFSARYTVTKHILRRTSIVMIVD